MFQLQQHPEQLPTVAEQLILRPSVASSSSRICSVSGGFGRCKTSNINSNQILGGNTSAGHVGGEIQQTKVVKSTPPGENKPPPPATAPPYNVARREENWAIDDNTGGFFGKKVFFSDIFFCFVICLLYLFFFVLGRNVMNSVSRESGVEDVRQNLAQQRAESDSSVNVLRENPGKPNLMDFMDPARPCSGSHSFNYLIVRY